MMSAQNRLLVVCGLLIAVASASVTALAVNLSRSPAVTAPPQPVLTLAASTSGNTITVVGVGIGSATPNQAQLYLGVQATRPHVGVARHRDEQREGESGGLCGAVRTSRRWIDRRFRDRFHHGWVFVRPVWWQGRRRRSPHPARSELHRRDGRGYLRAGRLAKNSDPPPSGPGPRASGADHPAPPPRARVQPHR